jgi:hypothetical protein
MQLDLNISDLSEMKLTCSKFDTILLIRQAIVSALSSEPGIARFLSCLGPSGKRLLGPNLLLPGLSVDLENILL